MHGACSSSSASTLTTVVVLPVPGPPEMTAKRERTATAEASNTPPATASVDLPGEPQTTTQAQSKASAFPVSLPKQAILGYSLLVVGVIMMFTGLGQDSQIASADENSRGTLRAEALANKAIHAQAGGAMMIAGAVLVGAAGQRS